MRAEDITEQAETIARYQAPEVAHEGALSLRERKGLSVILVNPPYHEHHRPGDGAFISVSIALLGTVLNDAGYDVRLIEGGRDPQYMRKLREALRNDNLVFIGFSVMTSQVSLALDMTRQAKRLRPDVPVVWGGFHPTQFTEQTIAEPGIDVAVRGEAAGTITWLADRLHTKGPLGDIPGLAFRDAAGHDVRTPDAPSIGFDAIPDINWDLYDPEVLESALDQPTPASPRRRLLPLLTGLGCSFRCAFCINRIYKVPYRTMNARRILQNLRRLKSRYGATEFVFYDEHFYGSKERVREFLEIMDREDPHILFYSNMRASDVGKLQDIDPQFFRKLRKIGGYDIGIGAESGNQTTLNRLNKGITPNQIRRLARIAAKEGITCTFSFIIGIPGETPEQLLDTLDLVREIQAISPKHVVIGPQLYRPYPGSDLFDEVVRRGVAPPSRLDDWKDFRLLSHFRHLDEMPLSWVEEPRLFARIIRTYNVQSYNALPEDLQNLFWDLCVRPHCPAWLGRRLRGSLKRLSDAFILRVQRLSRSRLATRRFAFHVEYPVVRLLDANYFKNL